jgi:hypothetical protein
MWLICFTRAPDPEHLQLWKAFVAFEESLQQHFNLEVIGQAHWYLATCMTQHQNFNNELNQSIYWKSVVLPYLAQVGCRKVFYHHFTPLHTEFIPTVGNCSLDKATARNLEREQYQVCFLNQLSYLFGHDEMQHQICSKQAWKILSPNENSMIGIWFYSNVKDSSMIKMISAVNTQQSPPLFSFSDSSLNDVVDMGCSTGTEWNSWSQFQFTWPSCIIIIRVILLLWLVVILECLIAELEGMKQTWSLHKSTLTVKAQWQWKIYTKILSILGTYYIDTIMLEKESLPRGSDRRPISNGWHWHKKAMLAQSTSNS